MGEKADRVRRDDPLNDVGGTGGFASFAAGTSGETAETGDVVRDIEQTRAEMTQTIDAIQERLAPEQLADQAKDAAADATEQAKTAALAVTDHAIEEAKAAVQEWGGIANVAAHEAVDHAISEAKAAVRELGDQAKASVRDATIGRMERVANSTTESAKGFRSSVGETIKQNPLPAALTGIGLGWLLLNRSSAPSGVQSSYPVGSYGGYGRYGDTGSNRGGSATGQAVGQVQQTAGQVAGQVQETAGQVAGQVQGAAGQVVDQVQQTAEQVQHQAQRVEDTFRQMLQTNPLPIGAIALAVGGAVGLALPATRRENELLGEARDSVVERVESTAQNAMQKVERVADEAQEAAQKEARYQGLAEGS